MLTPDDRRTLVLRWLVAQPAGEWFTAPHIAICAHVNGSLVYAALDSLMASGDVWHTDVIPPSQYQASDRARATQQFQALGATALSSRDTR
jgi:hypothetical protein